MDGATLESSSSTESGPQKNTFKGIDGNNWNGLALNNSTVKIYNSKFENISNDSAYAVNIIDCPLVDLRGNVFNTESDNLKGGVSLTYYNIQSSPNVYIGNNTFNSNNSVLPPLNLMSYAGVTVPAVIEGNTFSATTSNSTAMTLSGIIGGAVKSNSFTGYGKSLNTLSSSLDVSENTFTSTVASSLGIENHSKTLQNFLIAEETK